MMTLQISFGIVYLGNVRSLFTKAVIDGQIVSESISHFGDIEDWRVYFGGFYRCLQDIPKPVSDSVSDIKVVSTVPSNVRQTLQSHGLQLVH